LFALRKLLPKCYQELVIPDAAWKLEIHSPDCKS
jgi:hypothetical protein